MLSSVQCTRSRKCAGFGVLKLEDSMRSAVICTEHAPFSMLRQTTNQGPLSWPAVLLNVEHIKMAAKKAMEMTACETKKFVELYIGNECLWNPLSPVYSRRDFRLAATRNIILEMGNGMTGKH